LKIHLLNAIQNGGGHFPSHISRRIYGYLGLAALFFAMSLGTLFFVHRSFGGGQLHFSQTVFSAEFIICLLALLVLYFLADGLRLYSVIRAMGFRISFTYILKLVFVNIFVSNVTPLATGGGVVQIYFMNRKGIPLGEATAATSIRTMLAALMLFTITPIVIWLEPNEFRGFFHRHVLYAITGVSSLYVALFWVVLFRIRVMKCWLYRFLFVLGNMKMLSPRRRRTVYLRVSREMDFFSEGFMKFIRNGTAWAVLSFFFTALFLLLLFSFSAVLLKALGYHIPFLTVLAFQVVVTFFMYFAPTPGAAGIAEGGYGFFLTHLVQKKDITLLTISWRFLTIYIGVIIGIMIIYGELFNRKKRVGL
jgi:hypothetical protein